MCRIAAYAGPVSPLSTLLYDAPHSLERQSYEPRELVSGTVNVDGTGVAWWPQAEEDALLYVSDSPPWADPNLPRLAPRLASGMQLATVRSATPGLVHTPAATLPFCDGRIAGTHNGYLERYREAFARPLLERLSPEHFARYDVASDSLAIFLLVLERLRAEESASLADALVDVAREIRRLAGDLGMVASLNLVFCDGVSIAAVRSACGVTSNSLYVIADGARWPGAALVASERLDDDPAWAEVPAESLAQWREGAWHVEELGKRGRALR